MLTKEASKFCVFVILMILLNGTKAGNDMDPFLKSLLFKVSDENISPKVLSKTTSRAIFPTKDSKIQGTLNLSNNNSGLFNTENATLALNSTNLKKQLKTSANATSSTAPICLSPGVQAHESDCTKYYDCSLIEGNQNGSFRLITKNCPENQALNTELKRCSRDISSCPLDIRCAEKGAIADPIKLSSYYLCEPRLIGSGFRIFHVNCRLYEIFYGRVRKCDVDLEYLPFHRWDQPKDSDVVKAELKILRKQDKIKLKAEEKLQKEIYVKAVQDAQHEASNFTCVNKGHFASKIGNKFYISCEKKNDKWEAISMQCGVRGTFYPEFSACVYTIPSDDSSFSNDEDED